MSITSAAAVSSHAVSPALVCAAPACWAYAGTASRIAMANARQNICFLRLIIRPDRLLKGMFVALAGADAHGRLYRGYKDLPVPEFPGSGCIHYRVDGIFDDVRRNDDFDLYLWEKIYFVFAAPIGLSVALLAAVTLDLDDRHTDYAKRLERSLDSIQKMRSDDAFDFLHTASLPASGGWARVSRIAFSTSGSIPSDSLSPAESET